MATPVGATGGAGVVEGTTFGVAETVAAVSTTAGATVGVTVGATVGDGLELFEAQAAMTDARTTTPMTEIE
jgi:hypothetical protein